jgi:hypothetical protein
MINRFLTTRRLGLLFVGIFGVLVIGALAYQRYWAAPEDRCETSGRWWDPESRICAQPLSLAEITGRPGPGGRAEASAAKNRELVSIENRLAAEKKARLADADAQRARLAASREG